MAAASPARRSVVATARGLAARADVADRRRSTRRTAPICAPSMKRSRGCARSRRSAGAARSRAVAGARAAPALLPRHRRSDGADHCRRTRRRAPLRAPRRARWPLSGSCRPSIRAAPNGRAARSPKPATRICGASWSKPRGTIAIIRSSGGTLRAAATRRAGRVIIAQAWTAQQRLHRRYARFAARGKPKQHIVTAVARELTGFVWAALTQ